MRRSTPRPREPVDPCFTTDAHCSSSVGLGRKILFCSDERIISLRLITAQLRIARSEPILFQQSSRLSGSRSTGRTQCQNEGDADESSAGALLQPICVLVPQCRMRRNPFGWAARMKSCLHPSTLYWDEIILALG